jgi:bisphosphoglycerate-independent phosphoglycerate mutase (AlkP superfamily)
MKFVREWRNYDLIILNFANPDMVGHTGVVEAWNQSSRDD